MGDIVGERCGAVSQTPMSIRRIFASETRSGPALAAVHGVGSAIHYRNRRVEEDASERSRCQDRPKAVRRAWS